MPMGFIIIMVQGIMAQSITVIATKNIIDTVGITIIDTDSMVGIIDRRSTTADTTDTVIICIGIIAQTFILILGGIDATLIMDADVMGVSKVSLNVVAFWLV